MQADLASTLSLALVVDDSHTQRLLAREVLEQLGLFVEEAENGAAGLEAFERLKPDIVLMDVMMPEMDGFSACAALRKLPHGRHTPVLMLTALDDMDSIAHAYDVGATDFIIKPFNELILSHRVRYMLRASQAADALRDSEASLARAQRIARLGNWQWDIPANTLGISDEAHRTLDLPTEIFNGTYEDFRKTVHPEDKDRLEQLVQTALAGQRPYNIAYRIVLPDSSQRIIQEQAETAYGDDGAPGRVIGTVQDITDRKRTEEQLRTLAHYDSLTNLPNRRLFQDRLDQALKVGRRQQKLLAVLLLNIDRLKRVNDTFGHTGGDFILRSVSERLLTCVRQSDSVARRDEEEGAITISRLGGDEFTILLTDIDSPEAPAKVARRVLAALAPPFFFNDQEMFLTGCIGISLSPSDGNDTDSLLKNAGTAMDHAKKQGRNTYQFYAQDMNATAMQRLALENNLRKALGRNEFELHYQPQVDIRRWEIIGVEALIRWHHPDLGMVPPAQFIPLAEETGLIASIGEWALRTACTQHKAWLAAGLPPIRMAVNLSSLQFDQPDFCGTITQILRDTAIAPRHLELELTEGVIMRNAASTIKTLQQLKQLGITLSIDDFGTGYSSLSYLKRFPLDTLKIDRAFVKDVTSSPDDAAITTAIIAMAHSLNLRVLAEGVETEAQMAFLREQGCDDLQGYLVSKPLPAEELVQLLRVLPPCPIQDGVAASLPNKRKP